MPTSPDPNRLRVNWEINVSNILFGLSVIGGLGVWGLSTSGKVDRVQGDVASFQTSVTGQITDLRGVVTEGLKDVRQQIANLPDQKARLEQTERRLDQSDARQTALEARLGIVERAAIELRSDFNNVTRASSVPLGRTK
jgi:hypothetical protein